MMDVLDNPAWSALTTGNSNMAYGSRAVRFFDHDVSPFAGLVENTDANLELLYDQITHTRPVILLSPAPLKVPAMWKVLQIIEGFQMVHHGNVQQPGNAPLTPLTIAHVPQMLALTQLTKPGPFASRTIGFGHYYGIFDGDKLTAMAGQRLHAYNYAEISAVCTHPHYLGKGYARGLLLFHIQRIKAASEIPFLHVRGDNTRAIKLYQSLGFTISREVAFYVMVKGH